MYITMLRRVGVYLIRYVRVRTPPLIRTLSPSMLYNTLNIYEAMHHEPNNSRLCVWHNA